MNAQSSKGILERAEARRFDVAEAQRTRSIRKSPAVVAGGDGVGGGKIDRSSPMQCRSSRLDVQK